MEWLNGLGLSGYWGTDGSSDIPDSANYDVYARDSSGDAPVFGDSGGLHGHNSLLNDFPAEADPFAEFMNDVGAYDADLDPQDLFSREAQSPQQDAFHFETHIAEKQPEESLLMTQNGLAEGSGHGHASSREQADLDVVQIAHQPSQHPDSAPASFQLQPPTPPQTASDERDFRYHDLGGNSRHACSHTDYGESPTQLSNVSKINDGHMVDVVDLGQSILTEHEYPKSGSIPVTDQAPPVKSPQQHPLSTPPPSSRRPQPSLPCVECGTLPFTPRVSKCGHHHCPACVKATKGSGGVSKCGACNDFYKTTKTPEQHETTGRKQTSKKASPVQPEKHSSKTEEVKSTPSEKTKEEFKLNQATVARKALKSDVEGPSTPPPDHLVRLNVDPTALNAIVVKPSDPSRWVETVQAEAPQVTDNGSLDTQYETPKENPHKRKLAPAVSLEAPAPKKPRGTSAIEKRDTIKLQERAESLTSQIDRLKKQITKLKEKNQETVDAKQVFESKSNKRIGELEGDAKKLKGELKTQKINVDRGKALQKSLRATITEHNTTINAQQAEITSLTEQLAAVEHAQLSKVDELVNKREGSFKGAYERERENVKKIRKLKTEFEDKFKTEKEEREKAEAEVVRLSTVIKDMEQA